MRKIFLLLLLLIPGFYTETYSQTYPFRTYSIENGLSESVVNTVLQDSDGYIWLGTGYGLNRFDGFVFENYFEEHGLNSSKIYSLYQSKDGKLWIGSDKGINFADEDSIYTSPDLATLQNSKVISIFEDVQGDMWFGTDGDGVWHYNNRENLVLHSTSQGFRSNQVRAITQSENGDLWFATRDGLTQLSNGNLRTFTIEDGLPENRTRDILFDSEGLLWVATRKGLASFDGSNFSVLGLIDGLLEEKIQTLSLAADGSLWLGTESGVAQYKNGEFKNYTTNEGLSNSIVYSSAIDREGNVWFGTFGGGVSLFLGDYFENFDSENGLPNDLVTSIAESGDGKLWLGTYGGGLVSIGESKFEYFTSQDGLPDDRVYHLSTDSKDRMWIGMRDGLAYMNNGRLKVFSDNEFPFRKVRHVMEDSKGGFWISTYDEGLIYFTGEQYEQYNQANLLPSNTVLASVEGDDGSIWVATYGGVASLKDGSVTSYSIQDGLPNNGVMSIMKDKKGTIWVATFGGIAWFDGVRFIDITDQDGLPDRVCYFIRQDENGIYWIGTNGGMARLDVEKFYSQNSIDKEQAITVINREEGLVSNEMNLGAVYQDKNNHFWFGSVEGVSHFYPEFYKSNQIAPRVHILNLTASGREYDSYGFELNHNRNFVEIDYSAINFTSPNQVVYEYQMSGIDPGWQRTTDRSAKYPSLPPGEYFFRVHARNSNGIWSDEIAVINFKIKPPFWMSWWFVLLVIGTIVGIIYLFYRNYQYMKLVDIERMRVRIASDLHDDVGTSLTEIALQSDFLQAGNVDSEFRNSLNQIGKQCRKIVTSLDDIVWSIDARNDTLGDLTDRMQDYMLNVLEPNNFHLSYDFEELKMENKLPVPVKENLYLIFKEAVNNIAKYSNGDEVSVSMNSNNGSFQFVIHDNGTSGKGLKKTGHGLRNMEMRAQRIGANVDFNEEDGFTIIINGKLNMN